MLLIGIGAVPVGWIRVLEASRETGIDETPSLITMAAFGLLLGLVVGAVLGFVDKRQRTGRQWNLASINVSVGAVALFLGGSMFLIPDASLAGLLTVLGGAHALGIAVALIPWLFDATGSTEAS